MAAAIWLYVQFSERLSFSGHDFGHPTRRNSAQISNVGSRPYWGLNLERWKRKTFRKPWMRKLIFVANYGNWFGFTAKNTNTEWKSTVHLFSFEHQVRKNTRKPIETVKETKAKMKYIDHWKVLSSFDENWRLKLTISENSGATIFSIVVMSRHLWSSIWVNSICTFSDNSNFAVFI